MRLFSRVFIRKQIAELNAEREYGWLLVFQLLHLTPALEKIKKVGDAHQYLCFYTHTNI